MDRQLLEGFLAEGLSLEQIGRRLGKHPSTISYWLRKHGLAPVGQAKHIARGGIPRELLAELVRQGQSSRQISEALDLSQSTVRHWLQRYELKTNGAAGRRARNPKGVRGQDPDVLRIECPNHGLTDFRLRPDGYYRCLRCRAEAVVRRRRKVKEILVSEAGGACRLCSYSRSMAALHFHHLDPEEKSFSISRAGITRSLDVMRREAAKCVLLCSNCHAEVEAGVATVPERPG